MTACFGLQWGGKEFDHPSDSTIWPTRPGHLIGSARTMSLPTGQQSRLTRYWAQALILRLWYKYNHRLVYRRIYLQLSLSGRKYWHWFPSNVNRGEMSPSWFPSTQGPYVGRGALRVYWEEGKYSNSRKRRLESEWLTDKLLAWI